MRRCNDRGTQACLEKGIRCWRQTGLQALRAPGQSQSGFAAARKLYLKHLHR
jgi:hypothetical protein